MSDKINISYILKGHLNTLVGVGGKSLFKDNLTFFVVPALLAFLGMIANLNLSGSQVSLLVTFGAIFTALLLSVLVLVYEQENKTHAAKQLLVEKDKAIPSSFELRVDLLRQLYLNISYSIIVALFLIFVCFLNSIFYKVNVFGVSIAIYTFTPLALFSVSNLMLTIVMVVKRLHVLLILDR